MESFSIVKRGYNPQEVDEYIETLENVIKSYKDKDNAIKNAIISAQVAADNILKNTHAEISDYKANTLFYLKNIYDSIDVQRGRLQEFKNEYNEMLNKYLRAFETGDLDDVSRHIDELERFLRETSSAISDPNS
ncbi:MAG: DivIVA domain-containing protein [Defluviitaleaceae bacterium]|nr:DivIVA domain-containing protein [Defluviitaleaceae bacterium]